MSEVVAWATRREARSTHRGMAPSKPSARMSSASRAASSGKGSDTTPSTRRRPSTSTLGKMKGTAMLASSACVSSPSDSTTGLPVVASVAATRSGVGSDSILRPPKAASRRRAMRLLSRSPKSASKPISLGATICG